jgi:small conductance mechanosensitive channel
MENIYTVGFGAIAAALASVVVKALVIALICWIVIRVIMGILRKLFARTRFDAAMQNFLLSACQVALWFIAIIIVASSLGINVASLVAVLSVAGLALSLSVQGVMSNVFSGVTVLATHPFAAGDFVELNGISGVVETVGLVYTKIKTLDNKLISVPNSEVTGAKVINYSAEAIRRVDLTFCAAYDCPTEQVKKALMEAMEANEKVLRDPAPFAGLLSYKDSSIEYVARAWCKNADYWDVYFGLNESVRESFKRNGVEMSYAHLNIHVQK